jgi:hypothetical protein
LVLGEATAMGWRVAHGREDDLDTPRALHVLEAASGDRVQGLRGCLG